MFEATDIDSYSGRGGFWSVWCNGGHHDTANGYGYPWALATAEWIGRPEWVESVTIKFYDQEAREAREWTVVK